MRRIGQPYGLLNRLTPPAAILPRRFRSQVVPISTIAAHFHCAALSHAAMANSERAAAAGDMGTASPGLPGRAKPYFRSETKRRRA